MALELRGSTGELRYGYHVAARLGAWSLSEDRVEARAVSGVHPVWVEREPLTLHLAVGAKQWVWSGAEVVDPGTPFVIRVSGSPAVRDAS